MLKKIICSFAAASMMMAALPADFTVLAEADDPVSAVYPAGVTVSADEDSPTGYTAHFVYDGTGLPAGAEITSVSLHGSFRLISSDQDLSVGSDHALTEYVNGDFTANVHPHTRASGQSGIWGYEWVFDLVADPETGAYSLDIPMISGAHYYYYTVTYMLDGETNTLTTDDPANPSPCRENEEYSDSETGDITHSIVYGKWDPAKQSLSPDLDAMTPYEGEKGTLVYAEYKGSLKDAQDIGIYLPAGYDPDREEPYRVIYLTHGAGGNETYWFSQPQAVNIMDHVIGENPDREAIVVGMDNTLYSVGFDWHYAEIADNVIDYIVPYMEENYNVSADPQDRAFAGFSMGAMTTTYMAFHHADEFGYFGIFSGCNIGNATFREGFEYDENRFYDEGAADYLKEVYENIEPTDALLDSLVFTMAGDCDTAVFANGFGYYGAYETIRDWCAEYLPEGHFIDGGLVHGSHDIYTWAQCLETFARDIVWGAGAEIPEEGVKVEADENSPSGYTATFVYNPANDGRLELKADEKVVSVQTVGSFRLLTGSADMSEGSDHGLDTYVNGDYCANVHPHTRTSGQSGIWGYQWPFDMKEIQGVFVLSIPMISGAHQYSYRVTIEADDGSSRTVTLDDPANPSMCRENEAFSNSYTSDVNVSIVYGKWDPVKQSESPNLDYLNPHDGRTGTLEYVTYAGTLAPDQDMGVYLPAGYDPYREEPYRVIYLSHGAGGNETYWFSMGQAGNAMDAIAASDPDQTAIVVSLDNTLFAWNYPQIADNVVNYVIPYMEEHYNVSSDAQDRGFAGFSMGAMTTTYMAFHHPDTFRYFGIFSGCNIGNATFREGFEYDSSIFNTEHGAEYLREVYENIEMDDSLKKSLVVTMAGTSDTAVYANGFGYYGAYETIRDWCAEYMPEGHFIDGGLVPGSHDLYTWGQCFYTFAKDYAWSLSGENSLTLNTAEAELPTRTTLLLSANKDVTWTSSDEKIATVDENGLVTALRYGKVTITATAEDGETATCEIQTRYYDVNDDSKYYWTPVYWAADNVITKGYDNVYFGPQNNCTREAVVTFLWRLAGKPEPKTTKNPFSDVSSDKYYYKAVLWAAENGITKGYKDGTFRPDDTCLREHVVTFLYRYAGSPSVKPTVNPFNDVKLSDYYYRAAVWANENGIANGYSEGEHAGGFGPKLDCLREHVVTFLCRFAK